MTKHILVAVAWPYANGDLHIGHLAGPFLAADIFARYHRLLGNNLLMVSGSDAHGTPITIAADEQGIAPEQLFTRYHGRFLHTLQSLGISFDLFTHTHTQNHQQVAQDVFTSLNQKGHISQQTQRLLYSETEKRFLPDRYVEGTCPICGDPNARGDQCDACGALLDGTDLLHPRSKSDGSRPIVKESEHLFLELPHFSQKLQAYFANHAHHWRPNVHKFSTNYVTTGLKSRPITRDIDWGIPVPLPHWQHKKLYIWFENVIGYLSASLEWAHNNGRSEAWKTWWYDPTAESYYFLGKDNIPFHTIIWPAQLLGIERLYEDDPTQHLNLPHDIPANEFMHLDNQKFSKSRQHALWLLDLLKEVDADALRYYVAATLPETADSNFTWPDFIRRHNNELVATWGNLVHRVCAFAYKHWRHVPQPNTLWPFAHEAANDGALTRDLLTEINEGFTTVGQHIAAIQLRAALRHAFALARRVNAYLEQAPWFRVINSNKDIAATTVYTALWAIDSINTLLSPFLPFTAERVRQTLGYNTPLFGSQQIKTVYEGDHPHQVLVYEAAGAAGRWQPSTLPAGQVLRPPHPLYQKMVS